MTTNKRILCALGNGPARRNLFGPVDREQLQVEYKTALQKDLDEASRRWGFDFMSDKPLESGDFHWEGVPGTKVPPLYRPCMLGVGQVQVGHQRAAKRSDTPKGGRAESSKSDKENIPGSPERCGFNLENMEKTPKKSENTGMKRKQTNLKDFYQSKRRVVWMPRKSGE
ncbi:cyclin-dependent kinase inhibitor 1 isoform X2 [Salarias fasciatus]|uniref:Cyclin-dependent kinase inhibitor 1-like n=2 Tax=Salarias fasciatus TaxID=181472 RepID=A0A672J891_SALFA|nr:cyclin-dependent kinase inhibitor 1-like isoform X2 [Salarias fasciatus]